MGSASVRLQRVRFGYHRCKYAETLLSVQGSWNLDSEVEDEISSV